MKLAVCPVYAILYILLCSCFTGQGEDFNLKDYMLGDDATVNREISTDPPEDESTESSTPGWKINICSKRNGKVSRICYNFPAAAEIKFHLHLRKHNELSYAYQSIANLFMRDEYALYGFANYFEKQADRKLSDARKVYKYLIKRGGYINYYTIDKPKTAKITNPFEAFTFALTQEQRIEKLLLDLRWLAQEKNDPHLMHFLDEMEEDMVNKIKEIGDFLTRIKRVGDEVGLHLFDRELKD